MGSLFSTPEMPKVKATQQAVTAAQLDRFDQTENEKMNKRLAASLLTKDWMAPPATGKKQLLGA